MTLSTSDARGTFTPTMGRSTLTAVYPDRAGARHVIMDLRAFGLRADQIGVAMRDPRQQNKLIDDTGTHAAAGASNGAAAGRPVGGLHGLMAGLRANVFPGNPSIATAADAAQGLAAPGGMIGALVDMQMPEAEARQQESGYRLGSVLVTAKVFEGVAEAQGIMQRHGGGMVNQAKRPIAG